jgi:hypothetical protein
LKTAQELAPGLWSWALPHPDWTEDRGGIGGWEREVWSWLLLDREHAVFIDPLLSHDPDLLDWLDGCARGRSVHVLLTVYWHLRSAEALRLRYGATVWANARTREDIEELATGVITDRMTLPGEIEAFTPIPNDEGEEETAFWLPRQRALTVGDILVNTQDGLRIWWSTKRQELRRDYAERMLPTLRGLAELPVELILAPHGGPVTAEGAAALERAICAPPWQRP